ncbi:hypothetical protein ABE504_24455 [Paenibacillus oryzisoli]|uniref:hypothetical protein n=1 Tax=Paenibacillus oryzisoli TaxID=1850517 RepID=UPI003D2E01C4
MYVDLGCGRHKHRQFYGIDRLQLPGVDLVCDLNHGIPLPESSVEFVMASRSLPYLNNFVSIMSEIYRICSHQAVLCVLAPYAHHFRHMSNPYLKLKWDEYTPRYVTPHFTQPPGSPNCPPIPGYAVEQIPYDFRLLRMERFYEPPYSTEWYEQEELDVLQYVQPNVVSEIMYHFLIVKKELSSNEWLRLCKQPLIEPVWAPGLRLHPAPVSEPEVMPPDLLVKPSKKTSSPRKKIDKSK